MNFDEPPRVLSKRLLNFIVQFKVRQIIRELTGIM